MPWLLVFLTCLYASATPLAAQSVVITDCQGFTRALHRGGAGELNSVEVAVSDPTGTGLQGAEVHLTNSTTGDVLTAVSKNGLATFETVPPGTFTITTTSSSSVIGSISISSAVVSTAAAISAVGVTAAVAGGGAVVVGREIDERSDSSRSDSSPAGAPVPDQPAPEPTAEPTPERPREPEREPVRPPATPRPTPVCSDCDPDERPEPIDDDDFFRGPLYKTTPLSPHS